MINDPLESNLVDVTQDALGIDCEYRPLVGDVVQIKAVPTDLGSVDFGFESTTPEQTLEFELKRSDVPNVTRDDLLVFGADEYSIQDIEKSGNHLWIVRLKDE